MPVLYLLTSPPLAIPGTDAVHQDVAALKGAIGGETVTLVPRKRPGAPYPPQAFGFHALPAIWAAERRCDLTHIFHAVPYAFPVLRFLRKPIVYTVGASLTGRDAPKQIGRLNGLKRIVAPSARDATILKSWGLSNVTQVPPAIETDGLTHNPRALGDDLTLLMASAPWTEEQFASKGIDTVLEAAARSPHLRLILLWRGVLLDDLRKRITALGLEPRVEVVTEGVNVNAYLARAHATVLLASRGDVVKAYPHSLLESLVAGKPVILTPALPMADDVRQKDCGIVCEGGDVASFLAAVEGLRRRYEDLARNARAIEAGSFSRAAMIEAYRTIYEF